MIKYKLRMLLVEDKPINQQLIDFTLKEDFEIPIANIGVDHKEYEDQIGL